MIPEASIQPTPAVRLPETDRRVFGDKRVQRINHRIVLLRLRFVPVRASGETHRPATLPDAHAMLFVHMREQ